MILCMSVVFFFCFVYFNQIVLPDFWVHTIHKKKWVQVAHIRTIYSLLFLFMVAKCPRHQGNKEKNQIIVQVVDRTFEFDCPLEIILKMFSWFFSRHKGLAHYRWFSHFLSQNRMRVNDEVKTTRQRSRYRTMLMKTSTEIQKLLCDKVMGDKIKENMRLWVRPCLVNRFNCSL